jgi:Fe-S cluster biogenesis protein NfuA
MVVAAVVRRALERPGGGLAVVGVVEGVVLVRLSGTCGACPSSARAVIMGIEEELRRRAPEVEYLEVTA